jgi:hypothetical protein
MKNLREIIQPVINDIRAGNKSIEVSELWGASKALFLFGLRQETRRPVVIVTASQDAAESLADNLAFFIQKLPHEETDMGKIDIRLFPTWGLLPFEADS